jgi:hypothetical protein
MKISKTFFPKKNIRKPWDPYLVNFQKTTKKLTLTKYLFKEEKVLIYYKDKFFFYLILKKKSLMMKR